MANDVELERSFEPGLDTAVPDLTRLPGVASATSERTVDLEAVYFDTPARSLLRAGVTLRRRSGGEDDGWHLKIPVDQGREEIQLPLRQSDAEPPAALRAAVDGWTRGAELATVATITTRRTILDLRDEDGTLLAEFADDRVEGRPVRPVGTGSVDDEDDTPVVWREWELEVIGGGPDLLTAIGDLLASHDVPLAATDVKLARVIGAPVPPRPPLPLPGKGRPARLLLHPLLADHVAELGRRDSEIRRGDAGDDLAARGVHKARVACRRLRAALATYRPMLDRRVTDPIRDELRWLGHALGEARDLDVAHRRLASLIDALPEDQVVGPVHERLDQVFTDRRRAALDAVRDALVSERYFALREQLDRLAAAPPWTDLADEDAGDVLPGRVRREYKRLRRRVRAARVASDRTEHDAAIHAVRRAAKRLRYAAETLEPVWGKDAARLAKAAKRLASALGERQDAVFTRSDLLALEAQASAADEDTFTYGVLHAREQQRVDDIDLDFDSQWNAASRKGLRSWL
jgi:CHAD domain-containing protein